MRLSMSKYPFGIQEGDNPSRGHLRALWKLRKASLTALLAPLTTLSPRLRLRWRVYSDTVRAAGTVSPSRTLGIHQSTDNISWYLLHKAQHRTQLVDKVRSQETCGDLDLPCGDLTDPEPACGGYRRCVCWPRCSAARVRGGHRARTRGWLLPTIAGVPAPAQADLATLLANVDTYLSAVGATRVRRDANFDKVIGYELWLCRNILNPRIIPGVCNWQIWNWNWPLLQRPIR